MKMCWNDVKCKFVLLVNLEKNVAAEIGITLYNALVLLIWWMDMCDCESREWMCVCELWLWVCLWEMWWFGCVIKGIG